ncbi:MAG: hypothetical protein IT204_14295 [Fimbriimonadaceae bacterium]|nr:hypothetical protein [Fimbriimonadaceae bacterium]
MRSERLDLAQLRVHPLAQRRHLTQLEAVLLDPAGDPPAVAPAAAEQARRCVAAVRAARARGAAVLLIYGAHLLRNGAGRLLGELLAAGWVTHLATNGAGSIHDWEFAWQGLTSESVRENVANGTFGAWRETGEALNLALLVGGAAGLGYGEAVGALIAADGLEVPSVGQLRERLAALPDADPRWAGLAELLSAAQRHGLPVGHWPCRHPFSAASPAAAAWRLGRPWTVHPGIGYDIIACHPWYSGAAVGRAAALDFARFGASVDQLDGGVVLSIGTAIMGPQVFEKSLSCVNNLRLAAGRPAVSGHRLYVVDLQDGGNWDWTTGEPPKESAAYYLRFCKSYSRMGGTMHYVQADNAAFVQHLWAGLRDG